MLAAYASMLVAAQDQKNYPGLLDTAPWWLRLITGE